MSRVNDLANLLENLMSFRATEHERPVEVLNRFANTVRQGSRATEFIANFCKIVNEAKIEVEQTVDVTDTRKKLALKKIDTASLVLEHCLMLPQWHMVKNKMTESQAVESLQLIDAFVSTGGYKEIFDYPESEAHAKEIKKLIKAVSTCDLNPIVKNSILVQLQSLYEIFIHIDFYGLKDAETKVKTLIANIVVYHQEIEKSSAEAQTAIKKCKDFIRDKYTPLKYAVDAGLISTQLFLLGVG